MIEFNLDTDGGATAPANFAVSVIGIGGAGTNVLDRIALEGMPGADLICVNADQRSLSNSMAGRKVQIGKSLTQGLGAGGDPELGLEAAQSSEAEIRELLRGRSMVFICAGLGGGTGSGAAPYVAQLAKEAGAFVVVFATLPFSFEGRRRQKQATEALSALRRHANALVTFENDRMGELILPKKGIQEAFLVADKIIGQSVRAVTSLVTQPGLIRIGMDDLITALRNTDSRCLFGFGQAKGESRAQDAMAQALKSPLLNRGEMLSSARNVLVHVCGGNNMTLFEVETLMRELSKHVHEDAHILFGAASDPRLAEHVSVTILTSLASTASGTQTTTTATADSTSSSATAAPTPPPAMEAPAPVARVAPPIAVAPAPPVLAEAPPAPVAAPPAPAPVAKAPILASPKPAAPRLAPAPPPVAVVEPPVEEEEEYEDDASPMGESTHAIEDEEEEDIEDELEDEEFEEEEEEAPAPPPKKFAIRDVLMKPKAEQKPAPAPAQTAAPVRSAAPASTPFKPASQPQTARPAAQQQTFDERLQAASRGRFEKTEPTVEEGEDLDIPTFLRKKR